MIRKHLFFFFFFLCLISPSNAQHPLVLQKLTEWNEAAPVLSNERIQREVVSTAKEIYPPSDACSNSVVIIDGIHPATADRFVFNGLLRQQMHNAWTVIARLPGCDTVPVRYMIMQNKDKSLRTIRVNRGISYAHDSLITDTLPFVQLVATSALQREGINCEVDAIFKLGVTRIESEGDGLGADLFGVRYTGSWHETWPIETCGRTVEVLVKFTADGDGGAYYNLPSDQISILPR